MLDAVRSVFYTLTSAVTMIASLCLTPAALWSQAITASGPPVAAAVSTGLNGEVRDMVRKGDSLEVTYKNTGTKAAAIVGEVQVRSGDDELVTTVMLADSLIVKAGATQRFRVAMPKLAKGHYTLYAVVDFGGDAMTAAQAALQIK